MGYGQIFPMESLGSENNEKFTDLNASWVEILTHTHTHTHTNIFKASWLVVSTHLKNLSQIGSFPQIGVNIKHI